MGCDTGIFRKKKRKTQENHRHFIHDMEDAVENRCRFSLEAKPATAQTTAGAKPRDVVLYGFGRIGRLVARVLIEKTGAGSKMVLRAIVVRPKPNDLKKRLNLLINDSVHGTVRSSRGSGVHVWGCDTATPPPPMCSVCALRVLLSLLPRCTTSAW